MVKAAEDGPLETLQTSVPAQQLPAEHGQVKERTECGGVDLFGSAHQSEIALKHKQPEVKEGTYEDFPASAEAAHKISHTSQRQTSSTLWILAWTTFPLGTLLFMFYNLNLGKLPY